MKKLFVIIPLLAFVACTTGSNESDFSSKVVEQQEQLGQQGSLVIARPLPEMKAASSSLFGFMPQKQQGNNEYRLLLDRDNQMATVFKGALKVNSFPVLGIEGLEPGTYEVLHKQRRPVWYATDSYYTNRNLPLPVKNAKERYLKGALGDFVIFLNNKTPLHNSQVHADEVGGIRMQDNDIAQIYYQLEVGAKIQVQ